MLFKSTKQEAPESLKFGVYGPSGTGKSSIIKTLPCKPEEVAIFDIENGLTVLKGQDYQSVDIKAQEGDGIKAKLASSISSFVKDGHVSNFKWIVLDSFTMYAEKLKAEMESDPAKYDLLSKQGNFDGLKMYGELKKILSKTHDYFLSIPNVNKLVIYGAEEKSDNDGIKRMEVMIPGSYSDSVMFNLDEFYCTRVARTEAGKEYQVVTNGDGYYLCKSRMSGGSDSPLETYEKADLGTIIEKCYS